ncbi:MAG: PD-(D/E)XK nuclease family protein [bacterium]|nr:PD-(D/E)XK nuclease family protein [bacterium]
MTDADLSKIYSFSKLDAFDKCKKLYFFNYLDSEISPRRKEFAKPRDYNTRGQAVHGAITLFYYLPENKRTFEKLKNCLRRAWYSEKDLRKDPPLGILGGFKDIYHERMVYKESLEILRRFYNLEKDPDLFYVPTKKLKESFADYEKMVQPISKKYFISGKFDRIDKMKDEKLRVVDFKTGKSSSNFFQLEFYKYLAEANFENKVGEVSFYYLSKKKIIKNYDAGKIRNRDIKEKIIGKIKAINETKDFAPRPKKYVCSYCDFSEICEAFKLKFNR